MTLITAHSGCEGTPSGSEEYLLKAIASGADCLEVDLRLRGTDIFLSHEPLQPGMPYMTLEDCIEILRPRDILINCDLKEREAFPRTLDIFKRANMDHRLIFTGEYPLDYDDQGERYQTFLNLEHFPFYPQKRKPREEEMQQVLRFYGVLRRSTRIRGLNVYYRALSDGILEMLQDRVPVSCWTVDRPSEILRLMGWGVHSITTNRVCKANACRAALVNSR